MSESVNEHDQPTASHVPPAGDDIEHTPEELDALADEMSLESFPSSDPPSTWAGPDHG